MDRIILVIRKQASFCLIQTSEDVVKFPQFDASKSGIISCGRVNLLDIISPLVLQKLEGISPIIRGIVCTKSFSLPCSQKRLMAFYILIDTDCTEMSQIRMPFTDWTWQSIKSLEKKTNRAKFSSMDFALLKQILNDSASLNNVVNMNYEEVLCQWNDEKIVSSMSQAQNKLRLSAKYTDKSELKFFRIGSWRPTVELFPNEKYIVAPYRKKGLTFDELSAFMAGDLLGNKEKYFAMELDSMPNPFDIFKVAYVCLTFPEPLMTQDHFEDFLSLIQIADVVSNCPKYFRAFDQSKKGYLTFVDFVLGCAALEMHTTHGNEAGEQRCRYIFRYYCKKHDFTMSFGEFVTMIDDILTFRMTKETKDTLENQRAQLSSHFSDSFTMNTFLQKVGTLQLRGTSALFRSRLNVYDKLGQFVTACTSTESPNLIANEKKVDVITIDDEDSKVLQPVRLQTAKMRSQKMERDYHFSSHVLVITPTGSIEERISDLSGAISASSKPQTIDDPCVPEQTSIQTEAQNLLRGLEFFYKPFKLKSGKFKPQMNWHIVEMDLIAYCFMNICSVAAEICRREVRCLELDDPVFVLGDIHGNIGDLFLFQQRLWPLGPAYCPAKILFLGDYVDRGEYGFETVAYLLALKVLYPDRVYLLRGNHEIRSTQKAFQFHKECLQKFGAELGEILFETVNECFDCLPLCAIINKKVFATHGGIPSPDTYEASRNFPTAVNQLPRSLDLDKENLGLAWQLLWNDPLWDGLTVDLDPNGFGNNTVRKTGHVFSSDALHNFLQKHKFSHVIRAHQVQAEGFQIRFNAHLLTVFSSSSYAGMDNNAACVLLERNQIRLIQIINDFDKISSSIPSSNETLKTIVC